MNKKKLLASALINAFIFVSATIVLCLLLFVGTSGRYGVKGIEAFRFFTILSNVYCAFIALVVTCYEIKMLRTGELDLPHWLLILKQTGTTAVTLTLLTVCFFLAPTSGPYWPESFAGAMLFYHLLNPLLAIISFVFFEKGKPLDWKEDLYGVLPMLAYGIVYVLEVVVFKNWGDFYGFTFGGQAWAPYVVLPVMALLTYAFSFLLSAANKKYQNRKTK